MLKKLDKFTSKSRTKIKEKFKSDFEKLFLEDLKKIGFIIFRIVFEKIVVREVLVLVFVEERFESICVNESVFDENVSYHVRFHDRASFRWRNIFRAELMCGGFRELVEHTE